MARVEERLEFVHEKICKIEQNQETQSAKIDNLLILMAEMRGAAKVSKWLFGILVTSTSGVVSWFCGKAAVAAKVAAVAETGIHLVK